ncbi:hypothetical protein [Butyrivibrio fibrisolvens]|uniref:Uncharacterized protein n=1 Tax=Butyrivibrio fibrisolvens TaxID=831 RepID=A0A317G6G0_BUTFI|nr:hypothetical protein [Butyrivibrio fibrisolvens]PWT28999.1 hypothetical protein CPT75_18685 [Butyrivibrio fibrisolvens]
MKATVRKFTLAIMRDDHIGGEMMTDDELFREAYTMNVIDNQDYLHPDDYITRKAAARIIHHALLYLLDEIDVSDIRHANVLVDLYDCRTCVLHIAQVYCKGIMGSKTIIDKYSGKTFEIFDMNSGIEHEEMNQILSKIWNRSK